MSHQAEVERRHMNLGSWSPDEQYGDYGYPDTGFFHYSHIYEIDGTNKIKIPGAKSKKC